MKTNYKLYAITLCVLILLSGSALAQGCAQNQASQAERDLWNTHGCWQAFFNWEYQAYDMRSGDWNNRGWNDACNNVKEYPKHWNAAYLLTYGSGGQLAVLVPWNYRLPRHGGTLGQQLSRQPLPHAGGR